MRGLIAVVGLLGAAVAQADTSAGRKYDVATEEKLAAAVKQVTGHAYDGGCTRRPAELAKVIVVGSFAHDHGCRTEGYFADGEWVDKVDRSRPALLASGWSDKAKRTALALAWGRVLVGAGSVSGEPQAKLRDDGSVVVTLWVQSPVGMIPVRHSSRMEWTFSPEGDFSSRVLESKSEKIGGR